VDSPVSPDLHWLPCPLCGGEAYRTVLAGARDRLSRKAGEFSLQACETCELVATRPQPGPGLLAYYYQGVYSGRAAAAWQTGAIGRLAARYRLRALRRFLRLGPGQHLLEVGCGYGTFLATAAERTGCSAVGIDMDAGSLAQALARDTVSYHHGSLATVPLAPASFDSVAMFQSLEHHADPLDALRRVHALLKPGGRCAVEVPDFDGGWRRVFGAWWLPLLVPQHLFHFTPATLRRSFEAAGFTEVGRHRSMFYPAESTASLGLWLNEKLGRPLRRFQLRRERPDGALLLAALAAWWLLVEVPAQALLVLLGRSGHQLLVARKPLAIDPSPTNTNRQETSP
jgi:SAM-dependent methyltransferase